MPPIAKPVPAVLVPLSAATEAVVVEKRGVWVIRSREVFRLSWNEYERLAAFVAADQGEASE